MLFTLTNSIIFADSIEQHLERLDLVLTRLHEGNFKLSTKKCYFLQKKVTFLGHIVSEQGVETDPEKMSKVVDLPLPTNGEELKSYLALCGYYKKYAKNLSDH